LRLHPFKKGLRVLGIAESFSRGAGKKSILTGVVVRKDLVIDGFAVTSVTIGGTDSTDAVIELFKSLGRNDINLIMLNGCVIAWFNVIDLRRVHENLNLPLICVTYDESEGLEKYFREYFPDDWQQRLNVFNKNSGRNEALLRTGYRVFERELGIDHDEAVKLLNMFTLQGGVPEPLRLARLLARTIYRAIHRGLPALPEQETDYPS
jgi:endonuclease V-like protein UPF0215 family